MNDIIVIDTETTVADYAKLITSDSSDLTKVATNQPLIYDLSYVVLDGDTLEQKLERSLIISEIYNDTGMMNNAYYGKKRPLYEKMMDNGEAQLVRWTDAMKIFLKDTAEANRIAAFNAEFDLHKAMPFTKLYIDHKQQWNFGDKKAFDKWLTVMKNTAEKAVKKNIHLTYGCSSATNFSFYCANFEILDLWAMSCAYLINNDDFKEKALCSKSLTKTGTYFKTSAESAYRYLLQDYDFEEEHTALSDAKIEAEILRRMPPNEANIGVVPFPFKMLGTTDKFICEKFSETDITDMSMVTNTIEQMESYIKTAKPSNYKTGVANKKQKIEGLLIKE